MYEIWKKCTDLITFGAFIPNEEIKFLSLILLILYVIIISIAFIYWLINNFIKKNKNKKK